MSTRFNPRDLIAHYEPGRIAIAAVASHSALDVFDGAKDEGFRTIAVCQVGREKTYMRLNTVIDEYIILDSFKDVVKPSAMDYLAGKNAIIVPNRSFSVYVGYDAIESELRIPVFGNKYLLRYEERTGPKNYYMLLQEAGIRHPRIYRDPDEIDRPVIVKIPHARKRVERGFFIAVDRDDFYKKMKRLVNNSVIRKEDIVSASIEELVVGAHFNVNYFHSIARKRVELLSIDRRIQSNLDGFLHLTASIQLELEEYLDVEMIEVGHEPATIRESLLEKLFDYGDRFVDACKRIVEPGVIGPFTLQLIVTKDLDIVVYDVAPRIGGGTNIYMGIGSQYSKLYFGKPISMGRRIAIEIHECIESGCLQEIVT